MVVKVLTKAIIQAETEHSTVVRNLYENDLNERNSPMVI